MGAYGVLPTVYGTAELREVALTVRYGGFTAGNGATARIRVKTLMTRILRHSRQYDNTYDAMTIPTHTYAEQLTDLSNNTRRHL